MTEKRAAATARQRRKRDRDLVDIAETPDDEQRYIDAALTEAAESHASHAKSRDVTRVHVTKEIPPIPPKENTSSLRSEVKNVMESRAREPDYIPSPAARELAEAIGRDAGFEPRDTPPGWVGPLI